MKTIIPALAAVVFSLNAFAEDPKQAAIGVRIPDVSVKTADASEVKLREAVKTQPAVFIVDQEGVIRFPHANEYDKTRLDPAEILKAAREVKSAN